MGLVELFVAALIAGLSVINAAVAVGAWTRARDARLWFVAGANLSLLLVGLFWAWGQLPGGPSEFAAPSWPVLILVLIATLFLLGTALLPRRT
jgi:predicted lysophospholipase L1 biosynthesis ABC-type transport system permease subunit